MFFVLDNNIFQNFIQGMADIEWLHWHKEAIRHHKALFPLVLSIIFFLINIFSDQTLKFVGSRVGRLAFIGKSVCGNWMGTLIVNGGRFAHIKTSMKNK